MRKHQQKQILESIKTLYEATAEIKRFISRKDSKSAVQLLANCQEMAVKIGGYIRHLEGDGTRTVFLLEEYCRLLYQSSVDIGSDQFDTKIDKRLQKQLIKIENSAIEELKPKLELVFISYKASMSDSIESIYRAAKADPCCDAFFIPVPYFDVNPDHSLGTMHYEGADCYGDDIEITDWQQYDIEARHPDAVFTFNPYDEGNLVTRIHPDFFCRALRQHTDLLVYVPYFITSDDVMEHFCALPGCIYAHKVIVQSEAVRSTYIRVYSRIFSDRLGKAKDKFVALGSPKLDKVFHAKREAYTLPEEWSRLIGSKEIVLYNTSIGEIIKGGAQYLKKLRHVLTTFQARNDVVLWWRPHPLSEATYANMPPGLLEEYQAIVAAYKRGSVGLPFEKEEKKIPEQAWGIFDQSSDLHRSIAMSACYFGDGQSSLVALYKVTGKPLMFQNVDLPEAHNLSLRAELMHSDVVNLGMQLLSIEELSEKYPEYYAYMRPYQTVANEQYMGVTDCAYGLSANINAIYKIDSEAGAAKLFLTFPDEKKVPWLYNAPIRFGDKLIFAPILARRWAFYDFTTESWEYELLPQKYCPSSEGRGALSSPFVFKNEILFFPGESGAFAKYHLDTGKITYHQEWYHTMKKHIAHPEPGIITGVICLADSLLLISPHTNMVVQLKPETMEVMTTYQVGADNIGFKAAILIPNTDTVYLIPYRGAEQEAWTERILKWSIRTQELEVIENLPVHMAPEHTLNAFGRLVYWKEMVYLIPLQADTILRLDPKTDSITAVTLIPEFDFFARKSKYYEWAKGQALPHVFFDCGRMTFMLQLPYDYSLTDIDFETGKISNRRKWHVEGVADLFIAKYKESTNAFNETIYFSLDEYLEQVASKTILNDYKRDTGEKNEGLDGESGNRIFDYVKSLVNMG